MPSLLAAACSACAGFMSGAVAGLSSAIANHTDPETVRAGAPAYLLMVDGLIEGDPGDAENLLAGATLYAVYAGVFAEDGERARRLADRGWDYARRALCRHEQELCGLAERHYGDYPALLAPLDDPEDDVPYLFAFAQAWLVRIRAYSNDWGAIAELPKAQFVLERVIALDEGYRNGSAHVYLGMLETLRPQALGGRPEVGRAHFERALELSGGRDLAAKVQFAESYARLVFDRELHDRLLNEVLAAPLEAPGLTLTNALAKRRAAALLASADDYF
ncbi:MAG TPA: TRAP transporter TatT component family protein [Gammaproteobacteria bacterium]|nr:TRAP transporter TatT component family protein [Gammaproteobacteria bacterium]